MLDSLFMGLWMGFWGAVVAFFGAILFWKAIQGDITFGEAAILWFPLFLAFLFAYVAYVVMRSTLLAIGFGLAGGGYVVWQVVRQHQEERRAEEAVLQAEMDKWSRAVAADDRNAGAHLFLGHVLVKRGDYEAAASEYRRALELDPTNASDLRLFLGAQPTHVAEAMAAHLPDLERLTRAQRSRRPTWADADHRPSAPAASAGQPPCPTTAATPQRHWFGATPEEESTEVPSGLSARLAELRAHLGRNPDDQDTRLRYAQALAAAGEKEEARKEYEKVLARNPQNQEAADGLALLNGSSAG